MKNSSWDEHKDYECVICTDYLTKAAKTDCGHIFCHECITEWLKQKRQGGGRPTCPLCRETVNNVRGVPHIDRKVNKLRKHGKDCTHNVIPQSPQAYVACEAFNFQSMVEYLQDNFGYEVGDECGCMNVGCDWRGLQKHRAWHHQRCALRKETCPLCQAYYSKEQLKNHLPHCPCRPAECQYCHQNVEHCILRHHEWNCPSNVVQCRKCEATLPKCELKNHQRWQCPERIVTCFVCRIKVPHKNLNNHVCVPPTAPPAPRRVIANINIRERNPKPSIFLRGCRALTCGALIQAEDD